MNDGTAGRKRLILQLWLWALVVLCLAASLRDLRTAFNPTLRQADFEVYYTAASMIRHHDVSQLYAGADTGVDPQLRYAKANSPFAMRARKVGIDRIKLYVYPPTLAYMLVPLTYLPVSIAAIVWKIINLLALAGTGAILASLLGLPWLGRGSLSFCAFMLLFRPSLESLYWGQITAVLVLLMTAGTFFFLRRRLPLAMLLFTLAFAVKITPAIAIIPLIVWREWKALRYVALYSAGIFAVLLVLSGHKLLADYVQHVIPSMSSARAVLTNKSLDAAVQIITEGMHMSLSRKFVENATTALSALIIVITGWKARSVGGQSITPRCKLEWVTLFLLLSCSLAPVSWRHAYVLAAPAVIVLVMRAVDRGLSLPHLLLISAFVLSISSFGFDSFAKSTELLIFAVLAMLPPLLAILIVLTERYAGQTPRADQFFHPC